MPSGNTKILELNQYQKSDKAPFISYADLECLIEKIDGCKNIGNLKSYFHLFILLSSDVILNPGPTHQNN